MTAKKKATKSAELAPVEEQSTALAASEISLADMVCDAGAGTETVRQEDMAIPFLKLLQKMSPEVESVDGARPGMFFNTVTGELSQTIDIVPCAFQARFNRWAPGNGGFRGSYQPEEVINKSIPGMSEHGGRYYIDVPEGMDVDHKKPQVDCLTDTRNHFVLVFTSEGLVSPAVLSMSKTAIKKSKRFIAQIRGIQAKGPDGKPFNPPSFSHVYSLSSVKETNEHGTWYSPQIDMGGPLVYRDVFVQAKEFNKLVMSGEAKVQEPSLDNEVVDVQATERF